jgi:hypothetical protein
VTPLASPPAGRGVPDVSLDQIEPVGAVTQVLFPSGREVVQHANACATIEKGVDEVRPDEPGAACHEDESLPEVGDRH